MLTYQISSERELLSFLLAKLSKVDADVLLGHNISGFDLDVLLHRLQVQIFLGICHRMIPICMIVFRLSKLEVGPL